MIERVQQFHFWLSSTHLFSFPSRISFTRIYNYFFEYIIDTINGLWLYRIDFEDLVEYKVENVLMMRGEFEGDDLDDFDKFDEVIRIIFNLIDFRLHLL